MAQYIMRRLADGMSGEGERLFPKLLSNGIVDIDGIAEMIERRTSFTHGDVVGVLADIAAVVSEAIADGKTVKIDGLGTFHAVLGLVDKERRGAWKDSADRLTTGRNVKLKTVNFSPEKELIVNIGMKMSLERQGSIVENKKPTSTLEQRTAKARAYIAAHGYMRIADYASLVGLSKSGASLELRTLAADDTSGIMTSGAGPAKVYVARNDS